MKSKNITKNKESVKNNATLDITKNFLRIAISDKRWLLFILLFGFHLFFRFYQLEERMLFNWDQTDNAWTAKDLIIDHKIPLLGMVAKLNSGFNIGPLYYYYASFFYWIFDLNPIASPVIAGVTSLIGFFILFYVTKKVFNFNIALIALFINTFSYFIISSERDQWPVGFIVPVSLLIFYCIYNIIVKKKSKFILLLAIFLGLSLHIHFTSVFYIPIVLLTLPFFPRSFQTIRYILFSIPLFILFLIPNLIIEFTEENKKATNMITYLNTYFHGLHLRRVIQLSHDALIEFDLIFRIKQISFLQYVFFPLFLIVYYLREKVSEKYLVLYMCAIWIGIPWFVLSLYSGEISNYYFFGTRPIVLMVLAYLTYSLMASRYLILRIAVITFWAYFAVVNTKEFMAYRTIDFQKVKRFTIEKYHKGEAIEPYQNIPESYLYYIYTRKPEKYIQ